MFDFLFGWRKASRCKKLIKRVQCRLKILRNKRQSIVRQLREDVAQLIKIGYDDIAFNRVEQLFKDENITTVYESLDNFCEFILVNLSYIRRNKDCPNDVGEAISTLIYASARCGDLPELRIIRKLFGERYGQRFERTALELLPGNLVNHQVKESLSINFVSDELKERLVDEITRDYCLRQEILAIEYASELQQQESNEGVRTDSNRIEQCRMEASLEDSGERKAIYVVDSPSTMTLPSSHSRQNYEEIGTSISPSTGRELSLDVLEFPQKIERFENSVRLNSPTRLDAFSLDTKESRTINRACMISSDGNAARKFAASSSESLPQFPEEIIYLDEIEEVKSSMTKEGGFQDQRIFKFKSSFLPKNEAPEDSSNGDHVEECELRSKTSSQSISNIKKVKEARKRSRRPVSLENSSVVYYSKPSKRTQYDKHRTKSCRRGTSRQRDNISYNSHLWHWIGESDTEIEWCTFSPSCRRIYDFRSIRSDVPSKRNRKNPDRQSKRVGPKVREDYLQDRNIVSIDPCPEGFEPLTRNELRPSYGRNLTMPQERSKESHSENVFRSSSFPIKSPCHVHPNLPDYDDLAAKFMALKKKHLKNKCH